MFKIVRLHVSSVFLFVFIFVCSGYGKSMERWTEERSIHLQTANNSKLIITLLKDLACNGKHVWVFHKRHMYL
jgi:hypothetical protein